jgi:hypothetical protein
MLKIVTALRVGITVALIAAVAVLAIDIAWSQSFSAPDTRPHSADPNFNQLRVSRGATFPNGTSIDANGSINITSGTSQGLNVSNNTNQTIISRAGTEIVRLGNAGNDVVVDTPNLDAGRLQLNNGNNPAIDHTTTAARISGGVIEINGSTPTLSACGTSPTIAGNNAVGRVTVGTSPGTGCTLTFVSAGWTNAPLCVAWDETTAVTMRASSVSTSAVTFTASATLTASDKIGYLCTGYY